jgi:hypothetical protein
MMMMTMSGKVARAEMSTLFEKTIIFIKLQESTKMPAVDE